LEAANNHPRGAEEPLAGPASDASSMPTLECLLVGTRGGGGEDTLIDELTGNPPPGVRYSIVRDDHASVPGARALRLREIAFNRLVHPSIDMLHGLRAYRVSDRFDLVHVHNACSWVGSRRRIPVVMTVGGGSYYQYVRDYEGWPAARIDALYARARRILPPLRIHNEFASWKALRGIAVLSEFARGFLLRAGVPADLVRVIPPGLPTPPLPAREPDNAVFRFLLIGRHPRRKGADLFVEAVRRLRRDGRPVEAILVGDPSYFELANEEGFEVLPWVERACLYRDVFPHADALVHPARAEGFGLVVAEAMSFALPVVVSDHGALPDLVRDGETGFVVPVDDLEALYRSMGSLAADSRAAREIGSRARRHFEATLTHERHGSRMRRFYEDALAAG
jgi:glycosyltransferase involved in cell wall biosynthesis